MNVEIFKDLVEIQSIHNQKAKVLIEIKAEKKRMFDLETKLSEAKKKINSLNQEFSDLKKELLNLENQLYEVDTLINRNKEHHKNVTTITQENAVTCEADVLKERKNQLEESYYSVAEKEDAIRSEKEKLEKFYNGAQSSKKELEDEILESVKEKENEVAIYNNRIDNLFSIIPENVRTPISSIFHQLKDKGSLTSIEDGKCVICKMVVGKNLESLIERGNTLETCPGCNRILTPRAVKFS